MLIKVIVYFSYNEVGEDKILIVFFIVDKDQTVVINIYTDNKHNIALQFVFINILLIIV